MGLKPLQDWVLISRAEPEEKTAGGIIIPETTKDKPAEGVVLAVGPGRFKKEKGKKEKKFVPTVLKPGQKVMFIEYMAKDIDLGDKEITLIREDDILGTVEGSSELEVKPHYHIETKKDRPPMVQEKPREEKKEPAVQVQEKAPEPPKAVAVPRTSKKAAKRSVKKPAKTVTGTVAKKAAAIPKPAAKKTSPKKVIAKKAVPEKSAVKKTAPKKAAARKMAPRKTAAKKAVPGKSAVKKTAPKKAVVRKTAVKKSAARKPAPKKAVSKIKARSRK